MRLRLISCFFLTMVMSLLAVRGHQSAMAQVPRKIAVIAIERLTTWEAITSMPGVTYEIAYLESLGYETAMIAGTVENISLALAEPRVAAISFFGHGGPDKSTLAGIDAAQWKSSLRMFYLMRYTKGGMHIDEASRLADQKVSNFGLDLVRNASCYSLADVDIAQQFVRPGGYYYGVPKYFVSCPTPESMLSSSVDALLTKYIVPMRPTQTNPPQVNPPVAQPLPQQPPGEDCTRFPYCNRFNPRPER